MMVEALESKKKTRQLKFTNSMRSGQKKPRMNANLSACKRWWHGAAAAAAAATAGAGAGAGAVGLNLPASSPAGALPAAAEGDDELDMAATASSLLPASLDTVIVLEAGVRLFRAAGRLCASGTRGRRW